MLPLELARVRSPTSYEAPISVLTDSSIHQPLHAIALLLLDLIQTPSSAHGAYSRRVIDIIFALSSPETGLVAGPSSGGLVMKRSLSEGGKHAWEYLRRLRLKAWQKCNADPELTWSREDAIQYCNNDGETCRTSQDPGPMWSTVSLETMSEEMEAFLSGGGAMEGIADVIMGPPNIELPFLESLLGEESGFEF